MGRDHFPLDYLSVTDYSQHRAERMAIRTPEEDFLKNLRDSYAGQALIEIDKRRSEIRFKGGKPTYLVVTVKLFLGLPVPPGFLSRMEGCGGSIYDADR